MSATTPRRGVWIGFVVSAALLAGACSGSTNGPATEPAQEADDNQGFEAPAGLLWPEPLESLDPDDPGVWIPNVVSERPHDPEAFTQGLETLGDGRLLESTGLYGQSTIRLVDGSTGEVQRQVPLAATHFGEGLTVIDGIAIQLTWQEGIAYRWTVPDLEPLPPLRYDGEGWGICRFDDQGVTSNGSATLSWRDPETFAVTATAEVTLDGAPVDEINELECIDGHIVANVWRTNTILVIRTDGAVIAAIDASNLAAETAARDEDPDVLNGIAIGSDTTLLITGKLWSTIYEVELVATELN